MNLKNINKYIMARRMNLGFLFLTYDDIIHNSTKNFIKNYHVYVNAKEPNKIADNKYVITNYETGWGNKNIVDATIKMLETAYKQDHSWYILLAYDSFPLIRPIELESFLKYQTKSLFHWIKNDETQWKTSQWWIMNKADVKIILENYKTYNTYLETHPYEKNMGAWDELYFLSLLKYVNPAHAVRYYKPTYVKWLSNSIQKHPVTYGKLLETDIEECSKSFFIRKTTPYLSLEPYNPQKTLYIKIFGTQTNESIHLPNNVDLMMISLVTNDKIPIYLLKKSIHIYFSLWEYLNITILEVLNTIPTYLWEKIYILNEKCNNINNSFIRNNKESLMGIPRPIPNPPQFYNNKRLYYEYSPNKIAFLFLTIGDINQPNVWTKYFEGKQSKYSIYINPKYPQAINTEWLKDRVIKKRVEKTGWGFITEAYHNLLKEAMEDKDNMKFVFISESCVPLKSFDNFYNTMMMDDLRTSYVKFMNVSKYDLEARIKTQQKYETQGNFIKHYARMCLSRYHVEALLSKDFTFFNKMHVGDEFFLTLIHPSPGKDYMKDFEITYDNWEDVSNKASKLTKEIKNIYNQNPSGLTNNHQNSIRRKKALRDDISKNPKTYTTITTEDIEKAIKKESFFWRKFTNDPLPWTPEILNIYSVTEPEPLNQKPKINTLRTRKQRNKTMNKTRNVR